MKKRAIQILFLLAYSVRLFAQPGDANYVVNESTNAQPSDYNIRLKYLADSTMASLFSKKGFKEHFLMTCLQNPCSNGYLYANTFITSNPCTSEPQNNCKEAIVTYTYKKKGVPLEIKMLVTIKENGEYVQIENNQFGKQQISLAKQKLLSVEEIKNKISTQFPNDSLSIPSYNNPLVYYHTPIIEPNPKPFDKINKYPEFKIIAETPAAKNWKNGFIYIATATNPNKLPRVYTFDAITGKLLWITEVYNVPS